MREGSRHCHRSTTFCAKWSQMPFTLAGGHAPSPIPSLTNTKGSYESACLHTRATCGFPPLSAHHLGGPFSSHNASDFVFSATSYKGQKEVSTLLPEPALELALHHSEDPALLSAEPSSPLARQRYSLAPQSCPGSCLQWWCSSCPWPVSDTHDFPWWPCHIRSC